MDRKYIVAIGTIILVVFLYYLFFLSNIFGSSAQEEYYSESSDGYFLSFDEKISFEYDYSKIKFREYGNETSFWIELESTPKKYEMRGFAFRFVEGVIGNLNKSFLQDLSFEENFTRLNFEREFIIQGFSAVEYGFCDEDNCSKEERMNEFFIEYQGKIYHFYFTKDEFLPLNFKEDILNSIKFE